MPAANPTLISRLLAAEFSWRLLLIPLLVRAIHLAQVRPCLLGLPPGTVDGGYRRDAARS